jgi:cytoskeletal protein RodZ
MMQPETQEKKKGILDRLPKVGRISQLILIVGLFLVIFVALWVVYQQQPERQATLNSTLANLQKIVSIEQTPKSKFEAELAQATADSEAAKAAFPSPKQAPQILDSLMQQASLNDIYITQTAISTSTPTGSIGPVLSFALGLKGQIPKFQNFLLSLDTALPTSQIRQVTFTVAQTGEEYDTASVIIDVFCYEGGT